MPQILFAASAKAWQDYETPLHAALQTAGVTDVTLSRDLPAEAVDYIIYAPDSPLQDFTPYTRTKAVLSLWAGVETIVGNPTLSQPLCRMVDDGLRQGMVEWVTGHTLRHHLGIDRHIAAQDGIWRNADIPPLAAGRPVTVLGTGALGAACAGALRDLGFPVTGWSRSAKALDGIRCLSGANGLRDALRDAQIVICLLPQTPQTRHILRAETLSLLARGAFILNPGRGPLIDDAALLEALDTGQVGHATLDVFDIEPLPAAHPFWAHPRVTVTPHIASTTRPATAAVTIARNIARGQAGQDFLHLVDRSAGY